MLPWPPHGPCEALKRGGCEGASRSRISPEGEGETITAVGSSGDLARELGCCLRWPWRSGPHSGRPELPPLPQASSTARRQNLGRWHLRQPWRVEGGMELRDAWPALGTASSACACTWRPANGPLSMAPGRTQGLETVPASQESGSRPQPALPPEAESSRDPLRGCEMVQRQPADCRADAAPRTWLA